MKEHYKNVFLLNKNAIFLMFFAACINLLFFFYFYNPNVYFAITQAHGHIGYNFYKHNSVHINPTLTEHMEAAMRSEHCLIDYARVRDLNFEQPAAPFPINDTIGYGVLLGLLWCVTGSLRFIDVQILQMLLFILLMPLYYRCALLVFDNARTAFACGIAHIFFFPLIAYNVMPVRDVWAYYGLLVLIYAVCSQLYGSLSLFALILCALFFSICLWMRPTLFFSLLLLSFYAVVMRYAHVSKKSIMLMLAMLWAFSIIFFWLPYVQFNMLHYNRYVVSPAGQSLLEGLGEIQNPWGHKLSDEYVADYIKKAYGFTYGTPEFDEAAMLEFKKNIREYPWHYVKTMLYRLPDIFLPGLQWIFYAVSPYIHCKTVYEKLFYACSSFDRLVMFLLRHIYMRVYMLFAWIGMLLLWYYKKFKALLLIIHCLLAGLITFPSHIEGRYLIPFYWMLSFAMGYIFYSIYGKLKSINNL